MDRSLKVIRQGTVNDSGVAVRLLIVLNKLFPKLETPPRQWDPKLLADPINPGTSVEYLQWEDQVGKERRKGYEDHFVFEDKTVLDLGCGLGGGCARMPKVRG